MFSFLARLVPASQPQPLGYVEVPPVRPVLVPVEQPPPAKAKRASRPRMVNGVNQAVLRAIAAAYSYLYSDGMTLKEAAEAGDVSVAYTRAALNLYMPYWTTDQSDVWARRALLDAALHGDVPLLTAAYKTDAATSLSVA